MKKTLLSFLSLVMCVIISFTFTACGASETSIEVINPPAQCEVNQEVDVSMSTLRVTMSNGTTTDLPMNSEGITINSVTTELGPVYVNVSYKGLTTRFIITVIDTQYDFTFAANYPGGADTTVKVTVNTAVTRPDDFIRAGYVFTGWYTDKECTASYDFATPVRENVTIYAGWIEAVKVTFNPNYTGASVQEVVVGKGSAASAPTITRTGYMFLGWYTDKECTQAFNLGSAITADTELFAGWVDSGSATKTLEVTFDYNYEGAPEDGKSNVISGNKLAAPSNPQREGATFLGWFIDELCTAEYDFNQTVTQAFTLYACWSVEYVFEAEYVDLSDFVGSGYSGGAVGSDAVDYSSTMGASGGAFVSYMYLPGSHIEFVINSDRDVSDVTFVARLSAENKDFTMDPNIFAISVNGTGVDYEPIEFVNVPPISASSNKRPFTDHVISMTVSLKKGENRILLMTNNNISMGGTMDATAPLIDCIKLTTKAVLTWKPVLSNVKL